MESGSVTNKKLPVFGFQIFFTFKDTSIHIMLLSQLCIHHVSSQQTEGTVSDAAR